MNYEPNALLLNVNYIPPLILLIYHFLLLRFFLKIKEKHHEYFVSLNLLKQLQNLITINF